VTAPNRSALDTAVGRVTSTLTELADHLADFEPSGELARAGHRRWARLRALREAVSSTPGLEPLLRALLVDLPSPLRKTIGASATPTRTASKRSRSPKDPPPPTATAASDRQSPLRRLVGAPSTTMRAPLGGFP
jgi:hypothetical protein